MNQVAEDVDAKAVLGQELINFLACLFLVLPQQDYYLDRTDYRAEDLARLDDIRLLLLVA